MTNPHDRIEEGRRLLAEYEAASNTLGDVDRFISCAGKLAEHFRDNARYFLYTLPSELEAARERIGELEGLPERLYPDDGNGDDDAFNRGWNECLATIEAKRAASLLSSAPGGEGETAGEKLIRAAKDAFIVIHEGDGRHAVICHSHEEAAEAIIKGMWCGTVQEALEQDDFLRGMYEETINPDSDSWADFDGQRVGWTFEDGRVDVICIPIALSALPLDYERIREIRESLQKIRRHADEMDATGLIAHRTKADGEVCADYCNDLALDLREHADRVAFLLQQISKLMGESDA